MKAAELIHIWESEAAGKLAPEAYKVHLPVETVARVEALAEMFSLRSREHLISDLLALALDSVVASFPYIEGDVIATHDEEGDPVFEDVGYTPRYLELVKKHREALGKVSGD